MKSYSDAVADINPTAVETSASAGQALVEPGEYLTQYGRAALLLYGRNRSDCLWRRPHVLRRRSGRLCGGHQGCEAGSGNGLGQRCERAFQSGDRPSGQQSVRPVVRRGSDAGVLWRGISKFGASMKDYYNEISGIDLGKLSDVITQVWDLIELAEGVNGVNTSGLTKFADSMKKMGDAGISGFTDAFYNCGGTVNSAVVSMLTSVRGSITSNILVASSAMEMLVESMAGIVDKKVVVIENAVDGMMRNLTVSILSSSGAVKTAAGTVASAAVSQINSMKPEFETAGENAGQGFVKGVHSKFSASSSAGRQSGPCRAERGEKGPGQPFSLPGVHLPGREHR